MLIVYEFPTGLVLVCTPATEAKVIKDYKLTPAKNFDDIRTEYPSGIIELSSTVKVWMA